jgi:hypothetical protein
VLFVALNMIWQGHRQVAVQMDWADRYNASVPGFMALSPTEIEEYSRHPAHPEAPHPALPAGLHEAAASR